MALPVFENIAIVDIRRTEMRCLRRLCGFNLSDRIPNTATRAKCQVPMIAVLLRYSLYHIDASGVARMDSVR